MHKILVSLSVFLPCFPVKISQHPENKTNDLRNKIVYINACLKHLGIIFKHKNNLKMQPMNK